MMNKYLYSACFIHLSSYIKWNVSFFRLSYYKPIFKNVYSREKENYFELDKMHL